MYTSPWINTILWYPVPGPNTGLHVKKEKKTQIIYEEIETIWNVRKCNQLIDHIPIRKQLLLLQTLSNILNFIRNKSKTVNNVLLRWAYQFYGDFFYLFLICPEIPSSCFNKHQAWDQHFKDTAPSLFSLLTLNPLLRHVCSTIHGSW